MATKRVHTAPISMIVPNPPAGWVLVLNRLCARVSFLPPPSSLLPPSFLVVLCLPSTGLRLHTGAGPEARTLVVFPALRIPVVFPAPYCGRRGQQMVALAYW